jgi:thiamine monophosphate synthase
MYHYIFLLHKKNAVAIGGIDLERLPSVIAAGARNFAVVRAVCQSTNPYDDIQRLMTIHPLHHPK